jgi:hypothetical protein
MSRNSNHQSKNTKISNNFLSKYQKKTQKTLESLTKNTTKYSTSKNAKTTTIMNNIHLS